MPANSRWGAYARLMRLDKPIGALLLLWPTLWGIWLATDGQPSPRLVISFVAGVILMRSAGCVINDMADRHWDGAVARTATRPLATGEISLRQAIVLFITLILMATYILLQYPWLTWGYAILGLGLAMVYPFCKRFMRCPQAILGLAFSWGIPMAFAATQNQVPVLGWQLFIAASCWPIAYDTYYAMADKADDLKVGINSSAIWLGKYDLVAIAGLQLIMLGLLTDIGLKQGFSSRYFAGLGGALGLMSYHLWLARKRDADACFQAFLHNKWIGLAIFCSIITQ